MFGHLLLRGIARFLLGCLLAVIALSLPTNDGASTILGTIHILGEGGSGPHDADIPPQQMLSLSYSFRIAHLPGFDLFLPTLPPEPPCLGCEPVPTGFTGTTDYKPANTGDFNDFAAHLTNGIDEVIQFSNLIPGRDSGGNLGLESSWFGLTGDLQGDTVDFIRRVIITNTITLQPFEGGFLFLDNLDATWEIWGTIGSPVPEPSTLILLSGGLAISALSLLTRGRAVA